MHRHLKNDSTVNSDVINIQAANIVTDNYIVHEWNENNDISNVQQSLVSESCKSKTYLVSEKLI